MAYRPRRARPRWRGADWAPVVPPDLLGEGFGGGLAPFPLWPEVPLDWLPCLLWLWLPVWMPLAGEVAFFPLVTGLALASIVLLSISRLSVATSASSFGSHF